MLSSEQLDRLCVDLPVQQKIKLQKRRQEVKRLYKGHTSKQQQKEELRRKISHLQEKLKSLEEPAKCDFNTSLSLLTADVTVQALTHTCNISSHNNYAEIALQVEPPHATVLSSVELPEQCSPYQYHWSHSLLCRPVELPTTDTTVTIPLTGWCDCMYILFFGFKLSFVSPITHWACFFFFWLPSLLSLVNLFVEIVWKHINFGSKLPCSIYAARMLSWLTITSIQKVCLLPSLHELDKCSIVLPDKSVVSKLCDQFPNHSSPSIRNLGTPLMKRILLNNGNIKLSPYLVYCYNSLVESLQEIIQYTGFLEKCEMWRHRNIITGQYSDVHDRNIWKKNYACWW